MNKNPWWFDQGTNCGTPRLALSESSGKWVCLLFFATIATCKVGNQPSSIKHDTISVRFILRNGEPPSIQLVYLLETDQTRAIDASIRASKPKP